MSRDFADVRPARSTGSPRRPRPTALKFEQLESRDHPGSALDALLLTLTARPEVDQLLAPPPAARPADTGVAGSALARVDFLPIKLVGDLTQSQVAGVNPTPAAATDPVRVGLNDLGIDAAAPSMLLRAPRSGSEPTITVTGRQPAADGVTTPAAPVALAAPPAAPATATADAAVATPPGLVNVGDPDMPRELIVQFAAGVNGAEQTALIAALGGRHVRDISSSAAGTLGLVAFSDSAAAARAQAILAANPHVASADPNWRVTKQFTSNDPYYTNGSLWGMYGDGTSPANQYGSQAGEAWGRAANPNVGSKNVYVAVIDEGIDYTHPDLAANIWTNPFDRADGIDNDGNGYTDDVHGWDFANDDNSVYDGTHVTTDDTDAHGTHVAGTIGALGGNAAGVAGVNWNVTIISAKFLNPGGGTIADAIAAVDYITDLKVRHGLNIVAMNNSWGGGGYSQALHAAIIRAAKQNIMFVAAAGNGNFIGIGQNNDKTAAYPGNYNTTQAAGTETAASYDSVISVAAIDSTGKLASFSNYGKTTVDLGAPGVGVWSTIPGGYASYSGTSMATPHVTGGIALYAADHGGSTGAQLRAAVLNNAVATSSLNKKVVTNGRLNVSSF